MHGKNLVRKQELRPDGMLQVHEVFYTLQGEGPYTGHPAVFVRLSGCNLRCWFCDTHWDDEQDLWYHPAELVHDVFQVMPHHCNLLVLTGGEPMRQDWMPFVKTLWEREANRRKTVVQVETSGSLWLDSVADHERGMTRDPNLKFVVSPKAGLNPTMYHRADAYKYVVKIGGCIASETGLPFWNTQLENGRVGPYVLPPVGVPVYLSPCDEGDPAKNAANVQLVQRLALRHGYIGGVQLHKIMGLR